MRVKKGPGGREVVLLKGRARTVALWRQIVAGGLTFGTWRSTRSYSRDVPRILYSASGIYMTQDGVKGDG